jgi:hypothetical protein
MKKRILWASLVLAVLCQPLFADVELWLVNNPVDADNVNVDLYARSTTVDLTDIDGISWGIAYVLAENIPSASLVFDIASGWSGTYIGASEDVSIGSYDKAIVFQGTGSPSQTITSSSGGTLLATIHFTKVVSGSWGTLHLIESDAEDLNWFCDIYNSSAQQTLQFPMSDVSLPVQMASIQASTDPQRGISLTWETESERQSAGFHVWRSQSEAGQYTRITTALIPSAGGSESGGKYTYTDPNVRSGADYWYKIEEIGMDGTHTLYGPIRAAGNDPVPMQYALAQNFPNPFNPATTVAFELPEAAAVEIRVYTMLGKEVATLVNERRSAGRFTVDWDGTDGRGMKVASGVYFLRMSAGSYTAVRKMTYLR